MVDIVRRYWQSDARNSELLLKYALRYKRGVVFKRLGFLAEICKASVSKEWFDTCRINISKGISYLDPDGPKTGKIISNWNLKINLPGII